MAASGAVIITGHRRVDRALKKLPRRVQSKVVRRAIRAGLKVLQAGVKAEAPVDKGILRQNVVVRAAGRRRRGVIALEVRVEANDRTTKATQSTGEKVFYPATVQFGREGVAPDPFMSRAFTGSGATARNVAMRAMLEGAIREAKNP